MKVTLEDVDYAKTQIGLVGMDDGVRSRVFAVIDALAEPVAKAAAKAAKTAETETGAASA